MDTTVTTKGQVTIPKAVRDMLGVSPGSKVRFRRTIQGEIVIEAADGKEPVSRFAKYRGFLASGMTTDEIMALTRDVD
ncbi:MAG: AbrB/MazE/SpoVT family DNA-binding domain-containing protein [Sphingobium sp.]